MTLMNVWCEATDFTEALIVTIKLSLKKMMMDTCVKKDSINDFFVHIMASND